MKIGMIAMSGIRACDSELLELGLTLPGFVERSITIASLPSLGLLTLAGMTPEEHEVCYVEIPDLQAAGETLEPFDLVAISSYSAQINEAYALAERYRTTGTPVVMGGTHVTALPEEALNYCTTVVIGEGEAVWPEVLKDAASGTLKSRYGSYDSGFDLADAPMPAYELLDLTKYNRLTVQTSRGCPHRCEFCAGSNLISNCYKQKPVEKVLAEIDRICELWKHPFIEFADDNSFVNRAYWRELLPQLKERKIKWFTETDISVAQDTELLQLMRDAGCAQILIGLESPTAAPLDHVEQGCNWKHDRFADYKASIRTIQSYGITVNGCFIIGLDGQTSAVFDQVYDFVRDAELYEVQITILTPFPGTPLYRRLEKSGRLIEPENWKKCTLFDLNFRPLGMGVQELRSGFHGLVIKLYSDTFTQWRRETFRQNLKQSRRGSAVRSSASGMARVA
jgi:radical SAM superfamily enzyme YgiQ (UPF0313 family)